MDINFLNQDIGTATIAYFNQLKLISRSNKVVSGWVRSASESVCKLEYCWRRLKGRRMWLTPLHSSVDTHLPRWPKIVQEQYLVEVGICVSRKKNPQKTQWEKHPNNLTGFMEIGTLS